MAKRRSPESNAFGLVLLPILAVVFFGFQALVDLYQLFPWSVYPAIAIALPLIIGLIVAGVMKNTRYKALGRFLDRYDTALHKLRRFGSRRFSSSDYRDGMSRAGYQCEYAVDGVRCEAAAEHGDHYYPHSKGGATVLGNFVASCAPHNLSKSAKILADSERLAIESRREFYFPDDAPVDVGVYTSEVEDELAHFDHVLGSPLGHYDSMPERGVLTDDMNLRVISQYEFLKVMDVIRIHEVAVFLAEKKTAFVQWRVKSRGRVKYTELHSRDFSLILDDTPAINVGMFEVTVAAMKAMIMNLGAVADKVLSVLFGLMVPVGVLLLNVRIGSGIAICVIGFSLWVWFWSKHAFFHYMSLVTVLLNVFALLVIVTGLCFVTFYTFPATVVIASGCVVAVVANTLPSRRAIR